PPWATESRQTRGPDFHASEPVTFPLPWVERERQSASTCRHHAAPIDRDAGCPQGPKRPEKCRLLGLVAPSASDGSHAAPPRLRRLLDRRQQHRVRPQFHEYGRAVLDEPGYR